MRWMLVGAIAGCHAEGGSCDGDGDGLACSGGHLWQCADDGWHDLGDGEVALFSEETGAIGGPVCQCEPITGLSCYFADY